MFPYAQADPPAFQFGPIASLGHQALTHSIPMLQTDRGGCGTSAYLKAYSRKKNNIIEGGGKKKKTMPAQDERKGGDSRAEEMPKKNCSPSRG